VKKLLKCGAESFQLFSPQVPKELLDNIPVTGGESLECELEVQGEPLVIIKRGTAPELRSRTNREELLQAPVSKGQICAEYILEYDQKCVCTVNIVSKQDVRKMNWLCGVKKLLYNLIKL
jgi:D-alanyl-D-alanine carboxypeptidase (penicillin-binding protein 5/6)